MTELVDAHHRAGPAVPEPGGTAERDRGVAADPDRRVRLLHRLRGKADVVEAVELAVELAVNGVEQRLAGGVGIFLSRLGARLIRQRGGAISCGLLDLFRELRHEARL